MELAQVMQRLEALGTAKMRESNARQGAGENQLGIKLGDLRAIAKEIKTNHGLALQLWDTGNLDAMLLAVLIMKPREIPEAQLQAMVTSATHTQLADWLNSYVVKLHPAREQLREKWMQSSDAMLARAGWSLTAELIAKGGQGLDIGALLDRIEAELADAPPAVQWTMNFSLGNIGIHFPEHRERAVSIGERIGLYRDYPTSKGCTPPYVPTWVAEMVRRQG